MRISNCKGCGRIFNVLSDEQYCPNCQKKMDEKFDIVKSPVWTTTPAGE